MKTSELLNIDCRKEENKKLLNRFLWKVKPCAKLLDKNNYTRTETAPIELLEQVLHGICCKYNYGFNGLTGIHPYYENGVDIYTAALLNYENDVRASITCGMIFEKDKPHRYDRLYIHGTKGDIKSDTKFNQEGNASYTLIIEGKEQIRNVCCPHNYQLEIEQLGRCIIEGETPVVTADFSIKNAKILDAILQEIGYFESNVM